ncbi:hypothetical protein TWF281_007187 [Arthrobotrys megalospora]
MVSPGTFSPMGMMSQQVASGHMTENQFNDFKEAFTKSPPEAKLDVLQEENGTVTFYVNAGA